MKLVIREKKAKPFHGTEGNEIDYYWYSAVRGEDGTTIKFGSMNPDYEIGEEYDLELEKTERISERNGKRKIDFVYKDTWR